MRTILVTAAVCVGAVACGSGDGNNADSTALPDTVSYSGSAGDLVERGMSMDDVRNRLGEPRTRVALSGGQERWTYYAHDPQGQMTARTLVMFDSEGNVTDVNHAQR